jgi:hypothetical protein
LDRQKVRKITLLRYIWNVFLLRKRTSGDPNPATPKIAEVRRLGLFLKIIVTLYLVDTFLLFGFAQCKKHGKIRLYVSSANSKFTNAKCSNVNCYYYFIVSIYNLFEWAYFRSVRI